MGSSATAADRSGEARPREDEPVYEPLEDIEPVQSVEDDAESNQ